MIKIWLAGQVAGMGERINIEELVKLSNYFSGLCFCVNYQNEDFSDDDGTFKLLQSHKGNGKIIRSNWVNINSLGMTMAIQCGKIRDGDWVFMIDAQELPKSQFLENLPDFLQYLENQGIGSVWWGRPYIFKFNSQMTYQPTSCHCFPTPLTGKTASIQDESKVVYDEGGVHFGDFIYNKKKLDNSILLSSAKYWICHNLSNEAVNQFGQLGQQIVEEKEMFRREMRNYLQNDLNIDLYNFNELISYLKKKEFPNKFIEYMDTDPFLNIVFRYFVLNQDRGTILANRNNWSFSKYLSTGNAIQVAS